MVVGLAAFACFWALALMPAQNVRADESVITYPSYMSETTVIDSESTVFVMVDGILVDNLEQVYSIVTKALKLPDGKIYDLESLQAALSNSGNFTKPMDFSIIAGVYLQEKIGEEKLTALLDALNAAETANRENLTIAFWQ